MDHPTYDPRYLEGIIRFNDGEYFDAHEIWEELWLDCPSTERRFYQSLIQAAVALYHWENSNHTGAQRLFHAGREKMLPYGPHHLGIDVARFWSAMEATLTSTPGSVSKPTILLPLPSADDVPHE